MALVAPLLGAISRLREIVNVLPRGLSGISLLSALLSNCWTYQSRASGKRRSDGLPRLRRWLARAVVSVPRCRHRTIRPDVAQGSPSLRLRDSSSIVMTCRDLVRRPPVGPELWRPSTAGWKEVRDAGAGDSFGLGSGCCRGGDFVLVLDGSQAAE